MKVRSIPFSFWSNRGLQECSCKAVGPQTCIWQNRNLEGFWVLAKSFCQKRDLQGSVLDITLDFTYYLCPCILERDELSARCILGKCRR